MYRFSTGQDPEGLYQFNENPQSSISTKRLKRGKVALFILSSIFSYYLWESVGGNEITKFYRNRNIYFDFPKSGLKYYLLLFSKASYVKINLCAIKCDFFPSLWRRLLTWGTSLSTLTL